MSEVKYDWDNVERAVQNIAMKMYETEWRPDYIVGVTRGGLIPAVMLSHMTGIPLNTVSVQFGSDELEENLESNLWMAEDAYGYDAEYDDNYKHKPGAQKKILVMDDINRSGEAMTWIQKDWQQSCFPVSPVWDKVWHDNVRFASLISDENALIECDYYSDLFSDFSDKRVWVSFPWER